MCTGRNATMRSGCDATMRSGCNAPMLSGCNATMRPSCGAVAARIAGLALLVLLAACGSRETGQDDAANAALDGDNVAAAGAGDGIGAARTEDGLDVERAGRVRAGGTGAALSTQIHTAAAGTRPPQAAPPALQGRTRELVNPDEATVVFLYYDLTGSTPPLDDWVEEDPGVKYGPAAEKAGRRAALKPQLAAGLASVHDVGRIRLSMNANLSDYDPGYGEFTVRALAPSSYVEFKQFGQKVALHFTNGRTAQIWKLPAAQAQTIRDRLGYGGADLDVLVEITGVQPGPGGGSIEGRVVEYELREARGGSTLGRVHVDPAS
jgi:hypothetical protein